MALSANQFMEKWLNRFADLQNEIKKNILPNAPLSLKRKLKKTMKDFHEKVEKRSITESELYTEYFTFMAGLCQLLAEFTQDGEWYDKCNAGQKLIEISRRFHYDVEPVWKGGPISITFAYINSRDKLTLRNLDLNNIKFGSDTLLLSGFDGSGIKAFRVDKIVSKISYSETSATPKDFIQNLGVNFDMLPLELTWPPVSELTDINEDAEEDKVEQISLF